MSNILIIVAIGVVAVVLGMGLFNMMRGGDPQKSQQLMRMRVMLQLVAVVVIMLVIWAKSSSS